MSWVEDGEGFAAQTGVIRPRWNLKGERVDSNGNVIAIPQQRRSEDEESEDE